MVVAVFQRMDSRWESRPPRAEANEIESGWNRNDKTRDLQWYGSVAPATTKNAKDQVSEAGGELHQRRSGLRVCYRCVCGTWTSTWRSSRWVAPSRANRRAVQHRRAPHRDCFGRTLSTQGTSGMKGLTYVGVFRWTTALLDLGLFPLGGPMGNTRTCGVGGSMASILSPSTAFLNILTIMYFFSFEVNYQAK